MDTVPLREIVEAHHRQVNHRLDRIEDKIDQAIDHDHNEKVSWSALVGTLITLSGLLSGLFFAFS